MVLLYKGFPFSRSLSALSDLSESTQEEQHSISVFTAHARHDLILCLSKTVSLLYVVFMCYTDLSY